MKQPCKQKCPQRSSTCHGTCEKYKRYTEAKEALYAARQAAREVDSYVSNNVNRSKHNKHRSTKIIKKGLKQ